MKKESEGSLVDLFDKYEYSAFALFEGLRHIVSVCKSVVALVDSSSKKLDGKDLKALELVCKPYDKGTIRFYCHKKYFIVTRQNGAISEVDMQHVQHAEAYKTFVDLEEVMLNVEACLNMIETMAAIYSTGKSIALKDCTRSIETEKMYVEVQVPENKVYDHMLSFTKEESEKIKKWQKAHDKKCHKGEKPVLCAGMASRYIYEMQSTNIGMVKICKCKKCYEGLKKKYGNNIYEHMNEYCIDFSDF